MQKVFLKVLLGTVLLGNMPIHSWVQAEEIPEDIPQIEITEEAVPTDYNIVKSDNVIFNQFTVLFKKNEL